MSLYSSRALSNVTHMAQGRQTWNLHSNELWHWFKHASPLHTGKVAISPEIAGVKNEDHYVAMAREICRKAAAGQPGTEIKIRERLGGDVWSRDYLIWYEPPGVSRGLFLVIKDCGGHGEVETMFPPIDGRAYFEREAGDVLH